MSSIHFNTLKVIKLSMFVDDTSRALTRENVTLPIEK